MWRFSVMVVLSLVALYRPGLAQSTRVQPDPRAMGFIAPERVVAALVALAGSVGAAAILRWIWSDALRPLADAFIMRAIIRQRAEHERHLRAEIFAEDFKVAGESRAMAKEALTLAKLCQESLEDIRTGQAELNDKLAPLGTIADRIKDVQQIAHEAVTRSEKQHEDNQLRMRSIENSQSTIQGAFGELRRLLPQAAAHAWDGETERRGAPSRRSDGDDTTRR